MKITRHDIYRIVVIILFAVIGFILKVPENVAVFVGLVVISLWYIDDLSETDKLR